MSIPELSLSEFIGLAALIIAIPCSIVACFQLKDRFVIRRNNKGSASEKSAAEVKPIVTLFNRGLYKKLPMKQAEKDAKRIAETLKKEYYPTIIVGIGRGGSIFGSMLSYNLYQVPIFSMDRAYDWQTDRVDKIMFDFEIPPRFLERVLLVAGEAHSGNTMKKFISYLKDMGAVEVRTCAFYREVVSTVRVDYNLSSGVGIPFMPWQDKSFYRDSLDADKAEKLGEERRPFTSMVNTTLYIVRHGETEQNSKDIFIGGSTDEAPLNDVGIGQARSAGQIIKDDLNGVKAVIHCSPQERCRQTADLIRESLMDADLKPSPDLRERNYGSWEGKNRSSLTCSDEYRQYVLNPMKSCPPGAESMTDTIIRVMSFWKKNIVKGELNVAHVIVTHKTTGRVLLSYLLNKPYSRFREVKLDNNSVIKVTLRENEISHIYFR